MSGTWELRGGGRNRKEEALSLLESRRERKNDSRLSACGNWHQYM